MMKQQHRRITSNSTSSSSSSSSSLISPPRLRRRFLLRLVLFVTFVAVTTSIFLTMMILASATSSAGPGRGDEDRFSTNDVQEDPTTTTTMRPRPQADHAALIAAGRVLTRAYEPWPPIDVLRFPCYPTPDLDHRDVLLDRLWQDRAPSRQGLLYEKPPKCASSTVAGVNIRMARNVAQRTTQLLLKNQTYCDMRWSHGIGRHGLRFHHRDRDRSFLWTVIREPTKRFISHYFFKDVSVDGHTYSDGRFQRFLQQQEPHFYLGFLHTRPYPSGIQKSSKLSWEQVTAELNHVMTEYDYIGITERLDESLVVLMLLLKLPMADILYYSSKIHDGVFAKHVGQPCMYLHPSTVSEEMKTFLASDAWQAQVKSDLLLYQAANASLDLTIEKLGRDRVHAELRRFQAAQAIVMEQCHGTIVMPCDQAGQLARPVSETGCLVEDIGCGMECLDEVAKELGLL